MTTDTPFAVLEATRPLPRDRPARWEAVIGRGEPELLVVNGGARKPLGPLRVLAPGADAAEVLERLDAQAAVWAASAGVTDDRPTDRFVEHLVDEHVLSADQQVFVTGITVHRTPTCAAIPSLATTAGAHPLTQATTSLPSAVRCDSSWGDE